MEFVLVNDVGVRNGWGWIRVTTVNPCVELCASGGSFLSFLIVRTMSAFREDDRPKTNSINVIVGSDGKWNVLSLGSITLVGWIGLLSMGRKPIGL
jgi:hypothetical protein